MIPWPVACQAPLSTGFPQARILEQVAISFSRGSSPPRDQIHISCIGRWILLPLSHQGNLCTKSDVGKKPHSDWVRAAWDTIFKKAKLVLSSPAAPFSVSAFLLPVYYPPSRPSCKMLDSRTQLWAPPMTASLLLFIFFWPHHRAYEILVPPPEIEPMLPVEAGVLTPGPPGKSPWWLFLIIIHSLTHFMSGKPADKLRELQTF